MGEVSIGSAVEKLEADSQKLRNEGLEELKRILVQCKGSSRLDSLEDVGFHKIIEAIFRVVRVEKATYLRAAKPTSKSAASSRLAAVAAALRLTVEICYTKIEHRTANALLDHIVETLPLSEDGFCIPLRNDYLKSFRTLLEYAPHVEHFRPKQWQTLVEFCLLGLSLEDEDDDVNGISTSDKGLSFGSRNGNVLSLRVSQTSRGRSGRSDVGSYTDELVESLELLTCIPNAPLMSKATSIATDLTTYLEKATKSQDVAFEALNNVLQRAITENILLARKLVFDLIPVIRRLWSTKPSGLKDQILIMLGLSRPIFLQMTQHPSVNNSQLLESLLNTLLDEYGRRNDRDSLAMDDITFLERDLVLPLQLSTVAPITDSQRAVSNWTALSVMASLVMSVIQSQDLPRNQDPSDTLSRKRLKLTTAVDEVFHQAISSSGQQQLCAIQLLSFLVSGSTSITERVLNESSKLASALLDDDPVIASWTHILFSQLTFTEAAKREDVKGFWQQAWNWSIRNISTSGTCRAACHLLNSILLARLLGTTITSTFIESSLFSDGSNGPCNFSDAAIQLWTTILSQGLLDSGSAFLRISVKVVNWIGTSWTLPPVLDRLHNAMIALHARPERIFKLLMACMYRKTELEHVTEDVITSPVYRELFQASESMLLRKYLIRPSCSEPTTSAAFSKRNTFLTVDSTGSLRIERAIREMILSKSKAFEEAWIIFATERSSNIGSDVLQIVTSLCMVSRAFRDVAIDSDAGMDSAISKHVDQIWETLVSFISQLDGEVRQRELVTVAATLTRLRGSSIESETAIVRVRAALASPVLELLQQEIDAQTYLKPDLMELEESFVSQTSQGLLHVDGPMFETLRLKLPFLTDSRFQAIHLTVKLTIDRALTFENDGSGVEASRHVTEFVLSLDSSSLVTARLPLTQFFKSSPPITRHDACRLLKKLAECCLQDESFERCEASLALCLDVLTSFTRLWVSEDDDELSAVASDIYSWYLQVAIGKGISSSKVFLGIVGMLQAVLEIKPSFGADGSMPSPRTSLFQILSLGDNTVKYSLAETVSRIFDRFVLTEHDAIFDDVLDSLPSDPENTEGIAVRLMVLAELASKWHTVLRRAVYHLFETAAHIPSSAPFAQDCLRKVCGALNLDAPRNLLLLFAPQIMYTWLENETLELIPFQIFDYSALSDLLLDLQDEIVGQIAMRASAEHAEALSRILGVSWSELLTTSFAKGVAYAIARDISVPREDQTSKSAESSIRKLLGVDVYLNLVRNDCPKILANLFLRLSDDNGMDRSLAKRQDLSSMSTAFTKILGCSRSNAPLPTAQQPSFRAKYLVDILDFVYQRANQEQATIWDPPMLVYLFRTLLDDAIPAFGPLHACSIMRKLRIVVSFAGPCALKGYPLEMLLHNLRPYLTTFHCTEDSLGIFQYLLDCGSDHLRSRPSFLAGLAVCTFASISRFLKSSQDTTTQESQFRNTMSQIQKFHEWFVKYLNALQLTHNEKTGDNIPKKFRKIVELSQSITKSGSANKHTIEGGLLLALLDDRISSIPILTPSAFDLAIGILCDEFETVIDKESDILGDMDDVIRFAPVVCSIIEHHNMAEAFQVWAAQVLGRAYALGGLSDERQDYILPTDEDEKSGEYDSKKLSYLFILDKLEALIRKDDSYTAGLAEKTLQMISTSVTPQGLYQKFGPCAERHHLGELAFTNFPCPQPKTEHQEKAGQPTLEQWNNDLSLDIWASKISQEMAKQVPSDTVLDSLSYIFTKLPIFAIDVLPALVHLVLSSEAPGKQSVRQSLSTIYRQALSDPSTNVKEHHRVILKTIMYLRRMPVPRESTMADRNFWLDIDFADAACAALQCGMSTTAVLCLELHVSQSSLRSTRSSRRSSTINSESLHTIMHSVFKSLDLNDPDFFYGIQEGTDMKSIMKKLTHEGVDYKTLSFQSALYDSDLKIPRQDRSGLAEAEIFHVLSAANFHGLARAVHAEGGDLSSDSASSGMIQVSLNLQQWDLPLRCDDSIGAISMIEAFQALQSNSTRVVTFQSLDKSLLDLAGFQGNRKILNRDHKTMASWAILTEIKEVLAVSSVDELNNVWRSLISKSWASNENFDQISPILLGREVLFATIKSNDNLRNLLNISLLDAILLEVKAVQNSLKVARDYNASQFALNRAVYLSRLSEITKPLGLSVEAMAQHELAKVLWDHGEVSASTQILRSLNDRDDLDKQSLLVSSTELLADLGHEVAEARLEKPDAIIQNYLLPAIKALEGRNDGAEAGRIFHNFAAFCDLQLQNPDDLDDFARIEKIRYRKEQEVLDLAEMIRNADGKSKEQLKVHYSKAKTWFKLDDVEYKRLKGEREKFTRQSLENYLLSLKACDDYRNDVLRFLALWLDQSDSSAANAVVANHLSAVPSHKFALLMNQLSSRILDNKDDFQKNLFDLLLRICCDHPYHSLYQIFATSKTKGAKSDEVAALRYTAANKLADRIIKIMPAGSIWIAIHNSSIAMVRLANERLSDKKYKPGSKLLLREIQTGAKLEQTINDAHTKTPPPTMKVPLRADKNYSSITTFSKFDSQFSIAGGVSMPKIVTIIASDGLRYKMLLKGGNDDLRQDSIMEQVFEQVSNLLKDHRATRHRNLGIRTYKVIPLTYNAGIIEFVKGHNSLHDYLLPAHQRYFPKDFKPNRCRKEIADAQTKTLTQRLQAYRTVTANFHPVMRFFFMEYFLEPDDWFSRRLAYSRSTAAISILGHVLGLGDRHGHNILLDEKTGEVIHIDLGVAFEAGRVLPVPEVVPFRLTRDLVDGMGLTGVEGVFRRCCNFTLEALRQDQYSIMTILDVLRYDPLYSWSISPLRLHKMQEDQEAAAAAAAATTVSTGGTEIDVDVNHQGRTATEGLSGGPGKPKRDVNEPSEADRALTVVAKKLGKSLSVEATVNELIQQATDEKNLACLYCGWAAYA